MEGPAWARGNGDGGAVGSVQSGRDGRVRRMWAEPQERGLGLAGCMQKGRARIWGCLHERLGVRGTREDIEEVEPREERMGRPGLAGCM